MLDGTQILAGASAHPIDPFAGQRFEPVSAADFVAAPIGRCVVGSHFVIWCLAGDLQGAILWGAIDDRSIHEMMDVGRFIHHRSISTSRRVLVDGRGVIGIEPDALLRFVELARDRVPVWATGLARQAVVLPEGLAGLMLAGALPSLGVEHPVRFAHDLETAVRFVDHPHARAAHAIASSIAGTARQQAAVVTRLQHHLAADLASPTLGRSASALAISTRTLQRELLRLGTSFTREVRRARVAAAESLLLQSDLKIEAIARQLGFGTASRMSAALRREHKLTARALRARGR